MQMSFCGHLKKKRFNKTSQESFNYLFRVSILPIPKTNSGKNVTKKIKPINTLQKRFFSTFIKSSMSGLKNIKLHYLYFENNSKL